MASELRDGRLASSCLFELDDEDAAFAYAEERMRAAGRLAVTNRGSEVGYHLTAALEARDIDGAVGLYSEQVVYDDCRRLSGDPIEGRAGVRSNLGRICKQYSVFEARTVAVRGRRLHLAWTRLSDDAGNESVRLILVELGHDGLIKALSTRTTS